MRPSPRLLLLLSVWIVLGLLTAVAGIIEWHKTVELRFVFWSYAVVLGMLALLDYLIAKYTQPNLKVTRTLDPHLALGVRQKVTIKVSNQSARPQQLCLTDSPSSQIQIRGLPVEAQIAPGEHAVFR